jgi:tetratricopeptide (TPR) repeat protein
MKVQHQDFSMISMLKHFVVKNKILIGILLAGLLGVWYVILEINSSDSSKLTAFEISEIRSKVIGLESKSDSILTTGNTSKSIQLLDEALDLLDGNKTFSKDAIRLLEKKGGIEESTDNKEGAIHSYLTILEMGKKDSTDLSEIRKKLGTIYARGGNDDGLIDLFEPIFKEKTDQKEYVNACMFIATAYMNKQLPDSSLYYMEKAGKDVKSYDSRAYASILMMKSNYYLNKGDYDKGVMYMDSAQIVQEFTKDTTGLYQNYFTRAMLAYFNNDFKEVSDQLQKSISLLEKMNDPTNTISAYYNIGGAYGSMGDVQKENYYYRKAIDLKDSLETLNKGKTVADYVNNFQYKSKTDEVRQLNEKQELLQITIDSKQKQKYLLIAILILIGAVFVYGFRLFWAKQRQHKLNEEVLERDKQLLRKELEMVRKKVEYDSQLISEKEELISKLEDKLTDSAFEEKEQQELLSIIESMKDGLKQERENIGVDIMLTEDNAKFYKKLKEKHPDVSHTEARFCTLLYLNLDTKEIARILNISLDGVRKGRHRLRKKLDIGTGGDITNYLQGI